MVENLDKCDEWLVVKIFPTNLSLIAIYYAKQKHLGCKKGEANQKQQSSDCTCD